MHTASMTFVKHLCSLPDDILHCIVTSPPLKNDADSIASLMSCDHFFFRFLTRRLRAARVIESYSKERMCLISADAILKDESATDGNDGHAMVVTSPEGSVCMRDMTWSDPSIRNVRISSLTVHFSPPNSNAKKREVNTREGSAMYWSGRSTADAFSSTKELKVVVDTQYYCTQAVVSFIQSFASPFRREALRPLDVTLVGPPNTASRTQKQTELAVLRAIPRTCRCTVSVGFPRTGPAEVHGMFCTPEWHLLLHE